MLREELEREGVAHVPGVLEGDECRMLATHLELRLPARSAGTRRLLDEAWCRALVRRLRADPLLGPLLADARAVECTAFEKSRGRNWLVPPHQDRCVPVAARVDHPALGGWSSKEGLPFVQAPDELLARLLALRLHLDPCGPEDGPLRVRPGSHRADAPVPARDDRSCLAEPGAVWILRPLVWHASSKATGTSRRRVLHFLFGPSSPPFGLRWHWAE